MNAFKRKLPNGQRAETYSIKFRFNGKQVLKGTACTSKADALKQGAAILAALKAGKIPGILAQIQSRHEATVASVVESYIQAGLPAAGQRTRSDRTVAMDKRHLQRSLEWWGRKAPEAITAADHDDYANWRMSQVTKGSGGRAVELDLQSLNNAFAWAERRRIVDRNPFEKRVGYRDRSEIQHARQFMPESAEEFHRIAGALLGSQRSEGLGWAYILSCLTGLRHHEVRQLRDEPGLMDDRFLYVTRAKHGKNPRIRLDDPARPHIRPVLQAILAWRRAKCPITPWLIPGKSGAKLADTSLAHALERVCEELKLPKRSAHGARAYYATVRWSQGVEPDQIAHELGQRSGDDLVRQVYGGAPPAWDGDLNRKGWVPANGEPCWQRWLVPENVVTMESLRIQSQ